MLKLVAIVPWIADDPAAAEVFAMRPTLLWHEGSFPSF
jgi:hypothetical protein